MHSSGYRSKGFTLSELLIALAILGVIATFTIPKVLSSQQSSEWKSKAKEAAGMISGAYQAYVQENGSSYSAGQASLTPYMNYVRVDTSTPIDDWQTGGQWGCNNGAAPCLLLHNGAMMTWEGHTFLGGFSGLTSAIPFQVDPDATYSGTTTGPGKAVCFALYYSGRLTTCGEALSNTPLDPPWFSWN